MLKGTIVIPVLNEAIHVEQHLRLLRAQAGAAWRIVLVDGGSQDETVAKAQSLCDYILSSSAGRALQMNVGAAEAEGDLLLFLHIDTRLPTDFSTQLDKFIQQKRQWGHFDVQLDGTEWPFRIIEWMMNRRSRWTGIATGDQALFMTREFFQRMNGFQNLPLMEDVAFCKRAKRLAQPFCISSPVVTSARKWKKHGILRTVMLMWWLRLAFFLGVSPTVLHRWYYPAPCPR